MRIARRRLRCVIRANRSLAKLATKDSVHHTMLGACKRQAMDSIANLFEGDEQAVMASSAPEIEKLCAKNQQLLVERDFLTRASDR